MSFDRDMDNFAFGMSVVHTLSEGSLFVNGDFTKLLQEECSDSRGNGFHDFLPQFVGRLDIPVDAKDMFLEFFSIDRDRPYIGDKLTLLASEERSFIKLRN